MKRIVVSGILTCAVLLAATSCDRATAPQFDRAVPTPPAITRLTCLVKVQGSSLSCSDAPVSAPDVHTLILGGQGTYVQLRSSNVSYSATDSILGADVTIQNLILQPIGTTSHLPDTAGIRVFFESGPTVTSGSGVVYVSNPSGTAHFTAPSQPFFQYDEALRTNYTSQAKRWKFHVDPTVGTFSFVVYVSAAVPHPYGWIDVTIPCPQDWPIHLLATVRSVVGTIIPDAPITWSSSDTTLATVTQDGFVYWHGGEVYIYASSGLRSGSAQLEGLICLPEM